VAVLAFAGCGPGSPDVGRPCTSSSDCINGEACMVFSGSGSEGCDQTLSACSTSCVQDSDCNAIAPGLKCFTGCGDNGNFCAKPPN